MDSTSEQLNQSYSEQQPISPVSENKSKKTLVLLLGAFVLFGISITLSVFLLYKPSPGQKTSLTPPRQESFRPTEQKVDTAVASKIVSRRNVSNQKNLFASKDASSGFLTPSFLKKQQARKGGYIVQAQASELQDAHPFLFYLKELKQVKAFDISDGIEYELLDLRDIPGIIQVDKALIHDMRFLNTSKKIVFTLVERLDHNPDTDESIQKGINQYKMSLNTYDIKTKVFTKLIEITGKAGEAMDWQDFAISADEQYIFVLYQNAFDNPELAQIPSLSDSPYNKQVYIFYNLSTNTLASYKFGLKSGGVSGVQWDDKSESILFRYNTFLGADTTINFNRIYPDGRNIAFLQKVVDREFTRSQYIADVNKIFYISTGSNKNYDTFHQEIFGYLDGVTNDITDITPNDQYTTQFAYDYSGGVFYNALTRNNGSVTYMTLNRYDLSTKQSKKIADNNAIIVNFNGDYEHLLIGIQNLPNTNLYDFNIKTGEQTFLNSVPTVLSVYQ